MTTVQKIISAYTTCSGVFFLTNNHLSAIHYLPENKLLSLPFLIPNSCWDSVLLHFLAVFLLKFKADGKITSTFIFDFDLHQGDGNINILGGKEGVKILNPGSRKETNYLLEIEAVLDSAGEYDIMVASAVFDEYVKDWGGKLSTRAYQEIGTMMKTFSETHCQGRRYALLEGGYYYEDLGINNHAFCEGFL